MNTTEEKSVAATEEQVQETGEALGQMPAMGITPEQADAQLNKMLATEKKKKRRNRLIIAAVVVFAIFWLFIRPMLSGGKQTMSQYLQHTVERRDMTVSVNGSGPMLPADSYNILSLVKGEILEDYLEEGKQVSKEDLLYRIDSDDVEKSIDQAYIALENANLSYQNTLDTYNKLSPKATLSGRVEKLYVKVGDEVAMGAMLATISDSDNMLLSINFHEMNAKEFYLGQEAAVTLVDTGEVVYGTISKLSTTTIVGSGGTLLNNVEITVKNPGGIKGGTMATASVGGYSCAQSGTFAMNGTATVTASAAGTVSSINYNEGDKIDRDAVLLKINSDSAERQLRSAELSLQSANISLENALKSKENYLLTAPISGTVVEKKYKTGDKIDTNGVVLAVIYDLKHLTMTVNIDELDIKKIAVGQKVKIVADAVSEKEYIGYVDRVGVNGITASGTTAYPVKIILENFEGLLPGMNVTADILVEEAKDVLTVPISAVARGNLVLVVDANSKGGEGVPAGYKQVKVTVGRTDGSYVEILSGLNEGDIIAIDTATSGLLDMIGAGGGPGGGQVVRVN